MRVLCYFFFLINFLVNKLTNEKKIFWLAMFYQKIGQNVTFDFRASYRHKICLFRKNLLLDDPHAICSIKVLFRTNIDISGYEHDT